METNMTNDELVPSEDMPRPIVRHIAFLISLFVDLLLSLMSIQIVIFSYFGQTPSSTQWGFALTGAQAVVVFLFLVPLGFITSWRMLSQIRDDVRNEGFVLISPQRFMVVLGISAGVRVLHILTNTGLLPVGTVMMSALFIIVGVFSIFTGIILHELARRRLNHRNNNHY